jgi:dihydropteroate synthase
LDKGVLVGILNVTPDSFSDGGEFLDPEVAVAHGLTMVDEGAGIVDVGGESTRPGADPVGVDEEMRRVLPVVSALVEAGVSVAIDTSKPEVAHASVESGAAVVNDVTGFTNRGMIEAVVDSDCGVVVMHGREEPLNELDEGVDPVEEVGRFLRRKSEEMAASGVEAGRIALDPGIGFAKRPEQSLALLSGLDRLAAAGHPVMVGTSRKGFLKQVIGESERDVRDGATAITTALAYERGARLFRVHDVAKSRDALRIAAAIVAPH